MNVHEVVRFARSTRSLNDLPLAPLLIRLMVGCVFVSEGLQKFLFPDLVGVGRFIRIGIPAPEFFAPFVGIVEITCGALVLAGFFSRLAALPLIINMLVAIAATKIPILLDEGFWPMAHDSRTDWSMLLGSMFLMIVGAGRWSLDGMNRRRAMDGDA